jgi:DNA invertase Pin-like site-specific DNA recombinase
MAMRAENVQVVRAVVYCRISKDRGGDQLGVKRQEKDARALAKRNGWSVVEVLVDNDVEASSGKARPAYVALLDMIRAHEVDAVVVWDLDRLVRRPIELEQFFDVAQAAGMTRLATIGESVNITNGDGMLLARIKGAVAAEEVRKLSIRAQRKHQELAEAGRFSGGGYRPFGLSYDPETRTTSVVEEEKACIREAARACLAGESLSSIARRWNNAGMLTTTGRTWTSNNVRQTLESPRIAGLRIYKGEIVGDAAFPAMLDRELWERLQAKFKSTPKAGPSPYKYLLSRISYCALCDSRLHTGPSFGKGRYRCAKRPGHPGCGRLACVSEPVDELVTDMVLMALDSPKLAKALKGSRKSDKAGAAALDEVVRTEAKQEELASLYAADAITMREWLAARKPLEARLTSAQSRLARDERHETLTALVGQGADLRSRWESLAFGQKRATIEAVVDKVVIHSGTRGSKVFDPDRVSVVWRV